MRNKFQFFLQKYYDTREEQVQNHEAVHLRRFPYNVGDYVLVAIRESPNLISPKWSSPGRITTRISDWEYEVEDIETKVKSRHHIKNLRFLNQKDIGSKLSDEGLILWLALTQHDISHISEFKLENDKLYCKMHFNKSHSSNWEEVKNWINKVPSYFQIFIENPSLIPNERILNKLKNLIQNI